MAQYITYMHVHSNVTKMYCVIVISSKTESIVYLQMYSIYT